MNLDCPAGVDPVVLSGFIDAIPTPVLLAMDAQCSVVRMNAAFARLIGVVRPYRYVRDGRELESHELPLWLAIATGAATGPVELDLVFDDDGRVVRLAGSAAPTFDGNGTVVGAIATFVDVTSVRESASDAHAVDSVAFEGALAARLDLLSDVDDRLSETDTPAEVFDAIVESIVPRFCDAVMVLNLEERGVAHMVRTFHKDQAGAQALDEIWRRFNRADLRLPVSHDVARFERAQLIDDLPAILDSQSSPSYRDLVTALVDELGLVREILVPMRSRGITNGVIAVFGEATRVFTRADVRLLEEVGRRAASFLERTPS